MTNYRILLKDAANLGLHEHQPHQFTAEASELGFPVGQWPTQIDTDMGNGLLFLPTHEEVQDGDLLWITYRQNLGCISLKIFND